MSDQPEKPETSPTTPTGPQGTPDETPQEPERIYSPFGPPRERGQYSGDIKTVAERVADLSEEVLESVGDSQKTAIEAVRKFVDTLDETTPNLVDAELRKKILDAALDLAEQLANTTNEFLRSTVESAGKALYK